MTAAHLAAWLSANLIPFSVFGMALAAAGLHYDNDYSPRAQRVLGGLTVALTIVTAVLTVQLVILAVIPDMCNGAEGWRWWLWGCYLRFEALS